MRSLYLECGTGISGDMIVASLLDLGADEEVLRKALSGIKDEGFSIEISRVMKAGIDCCDFNVVLDDAHENHDHDMEYLYGHEHEDGHDHDHNHAHDHDHHHDHGHEHSDHDHGHAHDHHHGHAHEHSDHDHNHDHHHGHTHEHSEHDHGHTHDHHHDHDHDHDHDHHHSHAHHHEHDHGHTHEHSEHDHGHTHDHHHDHVHRGIREIVDIIDSLEITEGARNLAKKTFDILADAEAKAHRKMKNEVHFHEAGAIDSIVDIVAAAVCFDDLGIEEVIIPKLCEGQGSVRCQHGILPVPVPAVANIAQQHQLPLSITERKGELITPTGAAFAAAVMTSGDLPEILTPEKIGIGAGKREYKQPSMVRAILFDGAEKSAAASGQTAAVEAGESTASDEAANRASSASANVSATADTIVKLETNIDDSTGEQLGYVMERLLGAGARDVFYTPIYMKKNRPAWLLSVIITEGKVTEMEDIIFSETTTIGIRKSLMERKILERRQETVVTHLGPVDVKICTHKGQERVYPEYDSASKAAAEKGVTIKEVYSAAIHAYHKKK